MGVVNGLAYTSVGGEMLSVECAVLKGTGALQLTGKLGDVMQESAKAALSWVRAHCDPWGIPADFFQAERHSYPCAGGSGAQGRPQRGRDRW